MYSNQIDSDWSALAGYVDIVLFSLRVGLRSATCDHCRPGLIELVNYYMGYRDFGIIDVPLDIQEKSTHCHTKGE